jgi:hypothetical protein
MFFTNARWGVLPVNELNGRPLTIGAHTQQLARTVAALEA